MKLAQRQIETAAAAHRRPPFRIQAGRAEVCRATQDPNERRELIVMPLILQAY